MIWRVIPHSKFPQYKKQWAQLNNQTMKLAFFESEFVDTLARHFFYGDELLVVAFEEDEDELVFAAFFRHLGKGHWSLAMPSQSPLGLMLYNQKLPLNNTFISELAKSLPGIVMTIDFLQIDTRYISFEQSKSFEVMPYITTGNRPTVEDFDEYFQSLGKNMRQNYNKVKNRSDRSGDKLSWYKVTTPNDVEQALIKYGEIESSSWKNQRGTAISPNNEQGKFYREALVELAKQGQACCWYYTINEEIAAVDLCIQKDNCLIILKTTFDEKFNKQSPALMLKIEMLKYYSDNRAEEGINNIEFYGKAMDWHKRLNSELREIVHVSWYRSNLLKKSIQILKYLKSKINK